MKPNRDLYKSSQLNSGQDSAGSDLDQRVSVLEYDDHWTINNVNYRGKKEQVDLLRGVLFGERHLSKQIGWIERNKVSIPNREFHTPDLPLFYGIAKALNSGGPDQFKDPKDFLRDTLKERLFFTSTKVKYEILKHAEIIHNPGTDFESRQFADGAGVEGWLKDMSMNFGFVSKVLWTSDSPSEINDNLKWINGRDTYFIAPINFAVQIEAPTYFNSLAERFLISCLGDDRVMGRSLGVRVR